MNTYPSDDIQLLYWGDNATLKRLNTFLHGSDSAFSGRTLNNILTLDDLGKSLENQRQTIAIIALEKWEHDFELISKNIDQSTIQFVLLTNNNVVRENAKKAGIQLSCHNDKGTLQSVADILFMAQEVLSLKGSQSHLVERYQASEQRFKDVADQFADWLWEVDTKLNLTFSSARRRPGQNVDVGTSFTAAFLPEEGHRILDDFADLISYPRHFHDRDYWSADAHGSRLCWSISGIPVNDEKGQLVGFRGVARDISAQKANTDQLYYLSNHDALTGCHNRSRFFDEMSRSLRLNLREKRSSSFVAIGLDQFTMINDTYGHATGDKVLIHFAQILKDNLRTGDFLARIAGDEFGIILHDVTMGETAKRLDDLRAQIASRPMISKDGTINIRCSVGVNLYPAESDNSDDILLQGLHALTKAKEKGRNRIEFYSSEDVRSETPPDKLSWADLITQRLEQEEDALILHYQPIMKMASHASKEMLFYEVLVRMADEEGAPCPPHKFIETAEDFGLIRALDKQVSLRSIERLKSAHQSDKKLRLSVNLSGKTFADDGVREAILEAIKAAKLPNKSFIIEITESSVTKDLKDIQEFMRVLKPHGVGFALDDCGGGYSSFKTVQQLDIDFLKIDGSFIRNLHTNAESKAFVEAIQHIASQKGVQTIAEMVESNDIADALIDLKIDYGQGFYFGAPMAEID